VKNSPFHLLHHPFATMADGVPPLDDARLSLTVAGRPARRPLAQQLGNQRAKRLVGDLMLRYPRSYLLGVSLDLQMSRATSPNLSTASADDISRP
jgi:hypothetical protein